MPKTIQLLRTEGNYFLVAPTTKVVRAILSRAFTYEFRQKLQGHDLATARRKKQSVIKVEYVECFDFDQRGRMVLAAGFLTRCAQTLRDAGYAVRYLDRRPSKRELKVFDPNFENVLAQASLRHRQDEFLVKVAGNPFGRFDCAPGYGKSFMIALIAIMFPHARICVVSRRVGVLVGRIFPELLGIIPDVGVRGGGRNVTGRRVMCYTSGSLNHALGQEWDIVIVDECHEAASDDTAYKLAQFRGRPRMYGLSGSQDMRWDGKDMRCEALFGPILMSVGYQEGVANDMLVPLVVHWRDVVMDVDPCGGLEDVPKKRWGLWRNDYRNGLIAQDCRRHPGEQVIVTCEAVEHVVHLKSLVPEATLVYAVKGMEDRVDANGRNRREQYIAQGLLPADEPPNTTERHQGLLKTLQAGAPGIYICTGVINVGIDLKHCLAVCRAEGTASAIMNTQVPGRASRVNGVKTQGHVYDYLDQFNPGCGRNAASRSKDYAAHGWRQEFPAEDEVLKALAARQAQRRGA